MDRNTPGLDPATRQQLIDLDQDTRIKNLEDQTGIIAMQASHLADTQGTLIEAVSALKVQISNAQTQQKQSKLSQIWSILTK